MRTHFWPRADARESLLASCLAFLGLAAFWTCWHDIYAEYEYGDISLEWWGATLALGVFVVLGWWTWRRGAAAIALLAWGPVILAAASQWGVPGFLDWRVTNRPLQTVLLCFAAPGRGLRAVGTPRRLERAPVSGIRLAPAEPGGPRAPRTGHVGSRPASRSTSSRMHWLSEPSRARMRSGPQRYVAIRSAMRSMGSVSRSRAAW